MRNKYNYGELVLVNGKGKLYGKKYKNLGFIIEKDFYYDDYYVEFIFDKKDWFTEKYQVRLCTTIDGYNLINKRLKDNEPIHNNKLRQITIYDEFIENKIKYVVIEWNSVFWPISNKSIKIIENTLRSFRRLNIPFQYIVMNENKPEDITILDFLDNDTNVDIYILERNIKNKKNHH